MAFIANEMNAYTSCFTILFFVAKHTFHFLICIEVFKRSFANQTFIIHICYLDKLEVVKLT